MIGASRRIHGTEMEWPISIPSNNEQGAVQLNSSAILPLVQEYLADVPHVGTRSRAFLGNAALLYCDVGEHWEYATPEDDSFLGTVANEIASERIMRRVLSQVVGEGEHAYHLSKYNLNRRVIGDSGSTWGYHESYNVPANLVSINEYSLALLGVHLATRGIFTGAGFLHPNGKFFLAQKATDITESFRDATTRNKPVVNLRNEPLADTSRWRRVHVTSGDPNMSPWATRMKLGTTSLVLRLIEHGMKPEGLQFTQALHSIMQGVAQDLAIRRQYKLKSGDLTTAAEVQHQLMTLSKRLAKEVTLPEEELWVLEEWEKACADIMQDPRLLADRADWVPKRAMLERYRERHGLAWTSNKLREKDRKWDNIGPHGIGMKMREGRWSKWMPPEELISERESRPAETTRAHLRGKFVAAFSGHPDAKTDWEYVAFKDKTYMVRDPTATHDERVETLIKQRGKKAA
jgi:proteasome accessory factor A